MARRSPDPVDEPIHLVGAGGDDPAPPLPESIGYRLQKQLLGPPLYGDANDEPELGVPTALAVFSSDCISSSAYATEEILRVLIPVVGIYAFGLVVPITGAILVMLTLLVLSYRQTIRTYPRAGGAYLVARENFGHQTALVAGLSLLVGYVLTVAVSASAGVAALTSVFPALDPGTVVITVAVIVLIAWANLRGARESGRVFMVPTYLFIGAMGLMIVVGVARVVFGGGLEPVAVDPGMVGNLAHSPGGTRGAADAVLGGASLWVIMGAFATGSSALTGVEAISNGVEAFHPPEWRNARRTLVIMASILGTFVLGLGFLASRLHATPFQEGSPTVISQVGQVVFGSSAPGHVLYLLFQFTTLLVLFLGANTSFAGFPRLAGFAAGDGYLPRQLAKRGHRLVLSNGIFLLAGFAVVLVVVTGASVNRLIPFYGIGVFTSFTLSQGGMAVHHLRERERHWRRGLLANGSGCVLTFTVAMVFFFEYFTAGVWVLGLVVPAMVVLLSRMNRRYVTDQAALAEQAAELADRRILPESTVLVMVDRLDRATAAALRYARGLDATETRAVHLAVDANHAELLADQWVALGLGRIPLQIVECPDRRVANGAMQVAASEIARGDREVTVVLSRVQYGSLFQRVLHDRTATAIARALDDLPAVNVTVVPYHLRTGHGHRWHSEPDRGAPLVVPRTATATDGPDEQPGPLAGSVATEPAARAATGGTTPVAGARFRDHVDLDGRVSSVRVQPGSGVATLELTLTDASGSIAVVFLGRHRIAGISPGTGLHVSGIVGTHHGRPALLNPRYRILG